MGIQWNVHSSSRGLLFNSNTVALQTPPYSVLDEVSTVVYMGAAPGLSQAPGWAKEVLKQFLQRLFSLSCLSFAQTEVLVSRSSPVTCLLHGSQHSYFLFTPILRCFMFLSLYHCHLDVFTERYPGTQGSLTTLLCWTLHYRISNDVDKIAFNQATTPGKVHSRVGEMAQQDLLCKQIRFLGPPKGGKR